MLQLGFPDPKGLLDTYDEAKDIFLIYNDEDLYRFNPNIDDKPEAFAHLHIYTFAN